MGFLKRVKDAAELSDRLYRGKLAEAYDGIGQYVLVSLSLGSSSAAKRARVAAGDFGGGRVFPVGTPVTLVSRRGQLEVFLGNLPGICETFYNVIAVGGDPALVQIVLSHAFVSGSLVVTTDFGIIDPLTFVQLNPGLGTFAFPPTYGDSGVYVFVTVCYKRG